MQWRPPPFDIWTWWWAEHLLEKVLISSDRLVGGDASCLSDTYNDIRLIIIIGGHGAPASSMHNCRTLVSASDWDQKKDDVSKQSSDVSSYLCRISNMSIKPECSVNATGIRTFQQNSHPSAFFIVSTNYKVILESWQNLLLDFICL